jgi:AbrB family looped-hinge helix DNA binding protein
MRFREPELFKRKNFLLSTSRKLKQYQVTRKRQVTIPKKLAESMGIKPGDLVVFEAATPGSILLRKASNSESENDLEDVRSAILNYAKEVPKIKKQIVLAEAALIENISGQFTFER